MTDDTAYAEILRRLDRHEMRLDEHDDRQEETERRQDALYTGLALARWLIAIAIPAVAIAVALWRG